MRRQEGRIMILLASVGIRSEQSKKQQKYDYHYT